MDNSSTTFTPYVSVKKYADIVGLKTDQIYRMVNDGRLPIKPKRAAKETTLINIAAMNREALKQPWRADQ